MTSAGMGPFLPPVPAGEGDAERAREKLPAVVMLPWGAEEWAVVVQPGSDSEDLLRAVARMPSGLKFTESFGDVDVVLVYRVPAGDRAPVESDGPGPSRRGCAGAALRTAMDAHPARPDSRWMTKGERTAFRAGQVEALESVRRAVLHGIGVPVATTAG
ncbi:hypothetical protein [Parafrankia discariae]|uniref:hypothetical protein n=1 Tax=Parafrankia discariae TaxID=365528 RepID=UPI00054E5F6F|nr:hypothetical protein [Parafrankia discariae]